MSGYNYDREFQVFVKPVGRECNIACSYCYYSSSSTGSTHLYPGRMSSSVLRNYIRQHIDATLGDTVFFSWHGGEPLMAGMEFYREAVALQEEMCPHGKSVCNGIQTNGTLLNAEWGKFLAGRNFYVGLSLDGNARQHDRYRRDRKGRGTYDSVISAVDILKKFRVSFEILCVVSDSNVGDPKGVYRFLKSTGARFLSFLPLVERKNGTDCTVTERSVSPADFGKFLCTVYDEWIEHDSEKLKIQIIEEALRPAAGLDHTLCIFKKTCGGVPVVDMNGDFYACDHFVSPHYLIGNIAKADLSSLLDSEAQRRFGIAKRESLPGKCLDCAVLDMCNGECPKNRFYVTPDGEAGLNYLCEGYLMFFNHIRPLTEMISDLRSY